MSTEGEALKWAIHQDLWFRSRDEASYDNFARKEAGKKHSDPPLFPSSHNHWLNTLSMQRTNEPTDAVNTAEHPGAEMRLKGWSMDLGEQRKSIQHVTKAGMETKTWRADLWIEGKEGDHGTNGKSSMGTCTLSYVKQIASGNVL